MVKSNQFATKVKSKRKFSSKFGSVSINDTPCEQRPPVNVGILFWDPSLIVFIVIFILIVVF